MEKGKEIAIQLKQFFDNQGITQAHIAETLDVSKQYINGILSGRNVIGKGVAEKFEKYFGLSSAYLLTGKGSMVVESSGSSTGTYTTLLLPTSAIGGKLVDFSVSVNHKDCEKVVSPIKDIDFAMMVSGDSMVPEYPNGSRVFIKKINERAFIDWGRVYVLDTCNGIIIKKIMPGSSSDTVRCVSLNKEYPDFEVCFADMYGMYRVLLLLTEK